MRRHEGGRSGRCRELAALAGALAVTFALMIWGASSASAGGPTSVLVVSPQSTETAALYCTDKEYGELERLLGAPGTGTRDKPPEANLAAARQINVTWMVHDVSPWRLDRVFPLADADDVWIHTAENVPASVNGEWHRARNPGQLRALLKDLGLMGETSGEGHAIFPTPWQESGNDSATAEPETAAATSPTPAADDEADWWWALPGLAAGAVLALVLRPFAMRMPPARLRREPGPRQELRDV
ncbi:hypothetical protein [Streptomyces fulvoviolaceus]|uniref:hypothetical protein n=1 Tax=Streptomyces fulvoviolaceus TaxID=285535 RepID=UPI0004CC8C39|nr:hypothetical protein [Streptomyces fulvoviolaceus]MCT9076312.1 hypothetical protein [Streptomyces fulvoviolaceus]